MLLFFYSCSRELSFQPLDFFLHGFWSNTAIGQQLAADNHLTRFDRHFSLDDLARGGMHTLCDLEMITILKTQSLQKLTDTLNIITPVLCRTLKHNTQLNLELSDK